MYIYFILRLSIKSNHYYNMASIGNKMFYIEVVHSLILDCMLYIYHAISRMPQVPDLAVIVM